MPIKIKKDDTYPTIRATLKDGNSNAVNLSGASVDFVVKDFDGVELINRSASILTSSAGRVEITLESSETATAGMYKAKFVVTFSGGQIGTFPNDDYIPFKINE